MSDWYDGLRFPPSASFAEDLLDSVRQGLYTEDELQDVLLARELLFAHLEELPPEYEGFAGCTVEDTLVFAEDEHGIADALDAANPPGRLGYFHWVVPAA